MRNRLCRGILFSNKEEIQTRFHLYYSSPKFYRARGRLILSIQNMNRLDPRDEQWHIGIFMCTDYKHDMDDHIYFLSANDRGTIDNYGSDNYDSAIITCSVIHASRDDINELVPSDEIPRIDKKMNIKSTRDNN